MQVSIPLDAILIAKVVVCAAFAIVFLQSGLDKVTDWRGNLDWLVGHFGKSFLAPVVGPMLAFLTLLELVSGAACLVSVLTLFSGRSTGVPVLALGMCCGTLVALLFGQRVAKDYAGAATIAGYLTLGVLGLMVVGYGVE